MSAQQKSGAVGRILIAIKEFRQRTGYTGDMFNSLPLNGYLESRLARADYSLWTSLRRAEKTKFLYN